MERSEAAVDACADPDSDANVGSAECPQPPPTRCAGTTKVLRHSGEAVETEAKVVVAVARRERQRQGHSNLCGQPGGLHADRHVTAQTGEK